MFKYLLVIQMLMLQNIQPVEDIIPCILLIIYKIFVYICSFTSGNYIMYQ